MKKIILVVILALGFAFTSQAQTPVFQKGTKVGSVGVGFGSYGIPVELSMMWGVYNNVFGLNASVKLSVPFRVNEYTDNEADSENIEVVENE